MSLCAFVGSLSSSAMRSYRPSVADVGPISRDTFTNLASRGCTGNRRSKVLASTETSRKYTLSRKVLLWLSRHPSEALSTGIHAPLSAPFLYPYRARYFLGGSPSYTEAGTFLPGQCLSLWYGSRDIGRAIYGAHTSAKCRIFTNPLHVHELTLDAPGRLLAVPSCSTHLTSAALLSGDRRSRIICSMHWLEFMTSWHAISFLGQASWTPWALTPVSPRQSQLSPVPRRILAAVSDAGNCFKKTRRQCQMHEPGCPICIVGARP